MTQVEGKAYTALQFSTTFPSFLLQQNYVFNSSNKALNRGKGIYNRNTTSVKLKSRNSECPKHKSS